MTRQENCISANEKSSLPALWVESIASPLHMLPNLISAPLFLTAHDYERFPYTVCHIHRSLHANHILSLIPRGNRGTEVLHGHLNINDTIFLKDQKKKRIL